MEKNSSPNKSNKLLFTLCILFSLVSIVALILGVLSMTQNTTTPPDTSSDDSESYCNLDVLNMGNYSIGVSEANQNQLVLQSNLSTFPKIVFNLMDTNEPMMIAFNENNYFYYSYKNTSDIVQNYEPNIFENYKICTFGCRQKSSPTIEFANGVKIETSNNALRIKGSNAQWSFNTKSNIFEILNTLQSSEGSNAVLYFDGQYLCTNPTNSPCIKTAPQATLQTNNSDDTSPPEDDDSSNEKINGITFSNGYTLSTNSSGLILRGKYGSVKFNLNGTGPDIFTVENSLYYFYYSFSNSFGNLVKNNSVSGKTDLLGLGPGNPRDCSVWKGALTYGISNTYQQPLQSFELKENQDDPDISIYYDYTYSNDYIFPSETTTHTYETTKNDADQSGSSCNYLDRHNVTCDDNDNQYLYGFQLNYDQGSNQYSYTINCADYPGGTTGCSDKSTNATDKDGNIQELMKEVKCGGDEYLTKFKLESTDDKSQINYRCCKMNVKN